MNKLSPKEKELYRRVDEVITYIWDPIGIAKMPQARDEYVGYLPQVFKILLDSSSPDKLTNYLVKVAVEHMGNDNSQEIRKDSQEAAELLWEYLQLMKEGL